MGRLRFSFGTMGSGKSTVALQIHHNLTQRQKLGMLCTMLDRDGAQVTSRLGVSAPAVEVTAGLDLYDVARRYERQYGQLDFVVCDEAQFYTTAQCDQLAAIADDLDADVWAFGLLTDFRGLLFEGSRRLLELADERVELQVEARCWCGDRATHNARVVNGKVVYDGEVIVVGNTRDNAAEDAEPMFGEAVSYELLCRRHWRDGRLERRKTRRRTKP